MTDNNGPADDDRGEQSAAPIDDNFRAGLALLWQAYGYAQDAARTCGTLPWRATACTRPV